jgi:hypothetical protein
MYSTDGETEMKAMQTNSLFDLCEIATEVWSPVNNIQLSKRVERVQRRATIWIMMSRRGEMNYKEVLLDLEDLLLLTFDREVKDLVFLY